MESAQTNHKLVVQAHTNTWINVTTAHTITDLVDLEGTSVLNYDISGPAGDLSSTAIEVYVIGTGANTQRVLTDIDCNNTQVMQDLVFLT